MAFLSFSLGHFGVGGYCALVDSSQVILSVESSWFKLFSVGNVDFFSCLFFFLRETTSLDGEFSKPSNSPLWKERYKKARPKEALM